MTARRRVGGRLRNLVPIRAPGLSGGGRAWNAVRHDTRSRFDSRARRGYALGMPIADDNPRRAPRYWLTVHHPIGGALKYDLESLDPDDPAAVAAIAVDLKARGLRWPPPREFAEANLRRFRAAELASDGAPGEGERACDEYARLEAKWSARARGYRAERGRQREERGGRDLAGVRVGPPEAVALEAVSVTVRELRPVDAANRPLGAAYRLEYDELAANHDLKDPEGVLIASAGVSAWGWASIHAAGHMRARALPDRAAPDGRQEARRRDGAAAAARGQLQPPAGRGLPPRLARGEARPAPRGLARRPAGCRARQGLGGSRLRPLLGGAAGRAGPAARAPARLPRLRGLRGGRRAASRLLLSRHGPGRRADFRRGPPGGAGEALRARAARRGAHGRGRALGATRGRVVYCVHVQSH